jgi:hypothetical protein
MLHLVGSLYNSLEMSFCSFNIIEPRVKLTYLNLSVKKRTRLSEIFLILYLFCHPVADGGKASRYGR